MRRLRDTNDINPRMLAQRWSPVATLAEGKWCHIDVSSESVAETASRRPFLFGHCGRGHEICVSQNAPHLRRRHFCSVPTCSPLRSSANASIFLETLTFDSQSRLKCAWCMVNELCRSKPWSDRKRVRVAWRRWRMICRINARTCSVQLCRTETESCAWAD